MSATFSDGDTHFEVRCEPIEVTSMFPQPDMAWRFTDAKGHEHQWVGPDKHHAELPSLRWVWDHRPDDEYPGRGHYVCRKCRETIEPGMTGPTSYREFIAGPRFYFVNGTEVSEQEWIERREAAVAKLSADERQGR